MKSIYMGEKNSCLDVVFDNHFTNTDDVLKYIRHEYKAGTTTFYLDTPTDEVLSELKTLRDSGKMRHLKLNVHNQNDDYNFAKANPEWITIYN